MIHKLLGTGALIGAPWMFLGMYGESIFPSLEDSSFTGAWGIIFITAWMASTILMQRARFTGTTWFGKAILWIQLFTLAVANISNVYQLLTPENKPSFFLFIDLFWPLSNIVLLVAGITALVAKSVNGWRVYLPLIAGLWFPMAMLCLTTMGRTPLAFFIVGLYSAIAWTMLAAALISIQSKSKSSGNGQTISASAQLV